MTDSEYFALEALSQSGAKLLLQSPMAYRHDRDNPRTDDLPQFALGRAVHTFALQPHLSGQFSPGPDLSGCKTKDGKPTTNPMADSVKAATAAFLAANPGVTVLGADDYTAAQAMAQAALDAPSPLSGLTLRDLLTLQSARVEEAIVWEDRETDAPCKAKLDAVFTLPDDSVVVVDLKTTRSALTKRALTQAVVNFGYEKQAAWYLQALAQGEVNDAQLWFVFVQKAAPYEVAWIQLDGDALTQGAQQMRAATQIYAACVKSGNWPSAQAAGLLPSVLSLPKWFHGDLDEE